MIPFRTGPVILILALLLNCRSGSDDLRSQIDAILATQQGSFAVSFTDLTGGDEILINEHTLFHAASTMKTPVMIEVYRQASDGRFSLTDSIVVKNEFVSLFDSSFFSLAPADDSEKTLYEMVGSNRPINELVKKMITESSNLATNLLIELVDAEEVTKTMRGMGAKKIEIRRGVEDGKAYRAGLNNEVTAYDLMVIYKRMALDEVVSPEASRTMIRILLEQKFNSIIPAGLPAGTKVAHKSGWITGLNHDSGIVFLPGGGKYVLVLLSSDLKNDESAIKALAHISRLIYDWVVEHHDAGGG